MNVDNDQASQVPSEDVSSLTQGPLWRKLGGGNMKRNSKIFLMIHNSQKLATTMVLREMSLKDNSFLPFPTFMKDMAQQAHVESIHTLDV